MQPALAGEVVAVEEVFLLVAFQLLGAELREWEVIYVAFVAKEILFAAALNDLIHTLGRGDVIHDVQHGALHHGAQAPRPGTPPRRDSGYRAERVVREGELDLLHLEELLVLPAERVFRLGVDLDELLVAIRQVALAWVVAATLVKGVGVFASILRWDQLVRGQGYKAPLGYLSGSFLVGRFFGMFLPSTLGLDGYRAYDLGRTAGDGVGSVAIIVVEKITGFFTLSLLVIITLPAGLRFLPEQALIAAFVVFCVPVALSFFLLLRPGLIERALDGLLGLRFPGKARVEGLLRRSVAAVTIS